MRSVTLLLLAVLFLGALADTVSRRHVVRRRQGHGPPPRNGSNNHPAGPPHHEGENNSQGPPHNESNGNHPAGPPHNESNGNHPAGPPPKPLAEELNDVCDEITKGCEKEGQVSAHDGKVTDLCDNAFCRRFLPHNICFFECVQRCDQAESKEDQEACATHCMKCGETPQVPKELVPLVCDEVENGCKKENKTSHKDGTIWDLCDAKHCKEFLPNHMCFFGCAEKCENSATGVQAEDEACVNNCMKCQDPAGGDKKEPYSEGDKGPDELEGDSEGAPEGDANHNGPEHEEVEGAGEEEEGDAEEKDGDAEEKNGEEAAHRIVRLMRRKRSTQSFSKMFQQARGQAAVRRYARDTTRYVRREPVRRRAAIRGGYY